MDQVCWPAEKKGTIFSMNKAKAHAPTEKGAVYHLRCRKGDVAEYSCFCRCDPGRTERIAASGDDWKEIASYREYRTLGGTYKGKPISATSTGIRYSGARYCIHELREVGAKIFIRGGTMHQQSVSSAGT